MSDAELPDPLPPPVPAQNAADPQRLPELAGNVTLELFQVERSKTLSIPTQGTARVLILNADAIGLQAISENQIELTGRRIGSSLVHIFDQAGRRVIRVIVGELQSIVIESRQRKRIALEQALGYPARRLKIRYRGSHRSLERGRKMFFNDTEERNRTRTHELQMKMGVPQGLLVGDLYLEQRRDIPNIGKEVTQPRNVALTLQQATLGPFDEVDLVVGDHVVSLSRFTLSGSRFRGLALFPSEGRRRKGQRGRFDLMLFGGQAREGSTLDNLAGSQSRGPHEHMIGGQLKYHLWDAGSIYVTEVNRYERVSESRSTNVIETGLDWSWKDDALRLQGKLARAGPHGAYEVHIDAKPVSWLKTQNRVWRVSQAYTSVTGSVGGQGQSGWNNTVDIMPSWWNHATQFSTGINVFKDRSSVNPDNRREWNTAYSFGTGVQFPWNLSFTGGVQYQDQSASPIPSVRVQYDGELTERINVGHPWLSRLNLFMGYRRSKTAKSPEIPGADATLRTVRLGVRGRFGGGIWGKLAWSQAVLKEKMPEVAPNRIDPKELVAEAGISHAFEQPSVNLNFSFRYVNARNTFGRTHQPFGDRDVMQVNGGLTWRVNQNTQWFATLGGTHQVSETKGTEPIVDISVATGLRTVWDTGWVLPQSGRVSGYLFEDVNANGRRDPEESGRPGVYVFVVDGPRIKTNRKGGYVLRKVREGSRTLKVDWDQIPEGYLFTTPNTLELFVTPGQTHVVDFGITTEVELRGLVYHDINENRVFDEGVDRPIPGVGFALETGQSALSGPYGLYSIRRIRPGPHTASIMIPRIPEGYQTLVPVRKKFEGHAGEVIEFDLPLKAQRSLWGTVFEDTNANGTLEVFDRGLEGIRVRLGASEATTNQDGGYGFKDLAPGHYTLQLDRKDIPSGYSISSAESLEVEVPIEPFLREHLDFGLSLPQHEPKEPTPQKRTGIRDWFRKRFDPRLRKR